MKNWSYLGVKESKNVKKFIFTNDSAVCESVLYAYPTYEERTVICCSVQSGCPVGCTFCGTGNKFVRNLSSDEIVEQITTILKHENIKPNTKVKRFQIMFMSMGEPFLNYSSVTDAIEQLNELYPNAELLVSTVGINNLGKFDNFNKLSKNIDKIGLQFSIHKSTDAERDKLIPISNKLKLKEIRDAGIRWYLSTGRPVYLNYCIDGTNARELDFNLLTHLFSPVIFNFTFSVICSSDETMKDAGFRNLDVITKFENLFIEEGYNTRIFDPAGQDDIGGGCGQLWFVQKWFEEYKK